jgi:hypothetical protein
MNNINEERPGVGREWLSAKLAARFGLAKIATSSRRAGFPGSF